MRTIPAPIVSWETVVRFSDPIHEPTRERMRRLRNQEIISRGVQVHPRQSGRNSGSAVYYSALSAFSAQLDRFGDAAAATLFRDAGTALECRFADSLKGWLSSNLISDLPDAPFYPDMVDATRQAISDLRPAMRHNPDLIVTPGRIAELGPVTTLIESKRYGCDVHLELGTRMVTAAGASHGDWLWVIRESTGPTALITVMLAVDPTEPRPHRWHAGNLRGDEDDENDEDLADAFHQGIGKRPTEDQMRLIRERSAHHPTHRISLVG